MQVPRQLPRLPKPEPAKSAVKIRAVPHATEAPITIFEQGIQREAVNRQRVAERNLWDAIIQVPGLVFKDTGPPPSADTVAAGKKQSGGGPGDKFCNKHRWIAVGGGILMMMILTAMALWFIWVGAGLRALEPTVPGPPVVAELATCEDFAYLCTGEPDAYAALGVCEDLLTPIGTGNGSEIVLYDCLCAADRALWSSVPCPTNDGADEDEDQDEDSQDNPAVDLPATCTTLPACLDLNECLIILDPCDPPLICFNLKGSYACEIGD